MWQGKRSQPEEDEFREMLPNINLLFLGAKVLILLEMTYIGRSVHGIPPAPLVCHC